MKKFEDNVLNGEIKFSKEFNLSLACVNLIMEMV